MFSCSDSLVDRYVVMWEKSNSAASVTVTITDPSATTYTLMGLESETTYPITLTAFNVVQSTTSTPILVTTSKGMLFARKYYNYIICKSDLMQHLNTVILCSLLVEV